MKSSKHTSSVELTQDFTAIDVELANSDLHSICEIGVAKFRAGDLIGTWRSLVNPECEFETLYHSKLHGIKDHHTHSAATFPEVYPILKILLADERCIFHAASDFDPNCIRHACDRYDLENIVDGSMWTSTLNLAVQQWPDEPSYKLKILCDKINHGYLPHNALEDAIACAAVYRGLSGSYLLPAIAATGNASDRPRTFRRIASHTRGTGLKGESNRPFSGVHIVYSGNFSPPWEDRTIFEQHLCSLGFTPRGNISRKTKILVLGAEAGSKKIERAKELGVQIMTEIEFLKYIDL